MKKEKIYFALGLLMLLIAILQFSMIFDKNLDWEIDGNPVQGTIIFGFLTIIFLFLSRRYIISIFSTTKNKEDSSTTINSVSVESESLVINSVDALKTIKKEEKLLEKEYELPSLDLISENSLEFKEALNKIDNSELNVVIGKNKETFVFGSISKFPNMLIGGTITTGKTSFINTIICSLLIKEKPNNLKLLMIDSKKIEYKTYNGIPHLMCPVINDSKKAYYALNKLCNEIDNRYEKLLKNDVKNIVLYNKKAAVQLPNIVIIIDELTSISSFNDELSLYIEKIAQSGWNVGVHMIVVVNHPSSKIISTIAKNNFPTRIAFRTTSMSDSRMILDKNGAEKLNGIGNILYSSIQNSDTENLNAIFIDDKDILSIVEYVCKQQSTNFKNTMGLHNEFKSDYDDPLYNEIVEFAITTGKISVSLIQGRFRLGYNRAARLIDLLEERGIIGPANGSKLREVLIRLED